MKKIILIGILLISILILSGCKNAGEVVDEQQVMDSSCGDGVCNPDENECSCAQDCGQCSGDVEEKTCMKLDCVDGMCKEVSKKLCCGNALCEKGEEKTCMDCPTCNDYDVCTEDWFNLEKLRCENTVVEPCCGNNICESAENSDNCLLDCAKNVGLEDYPSIFEGKSVLIVVGAKASASDVAAATEISGSLDATITTVLDNEINTIDRDAIVIGTPCDNEFSKELLPYDRDCLEYFEKGTGIIRLFKQGSYYIILIAGDPVSKTREAAGVLRDQNNLEGIEVVIN